MQIEGKHVLVTGGAGFIGSNLVDALLDRGCRVRVVDDFSAGRKDNLIHAEGMGAEVRYLDICDRTGMVDAVRDIDVVMHLAVSSLRVALFDPWRNHDVNAGGTLSVLEAVAGAGVERFLYCSSSEVYGTALTTPMTEDHPTNPTTVYGASKLAGEGYTSAFRLTSGVAAVIVRPFNTYGYREHHEGPSGEVIPRMVLRALNGVPPMIFGDGSQTRDFTFVTDTVRGLIASVEADELVGGIVNIAYGQEVSVSRIAELVCSACGVALEPVHGVPRPADVQRHSADVTKARDQLGFRPEVPIESGIERYVAWFRDHHPDPRALLGEEREQNWLVPEA